MKSSLSPVNHYRSKGKRIAFVLLSAFFLMPSVCESRTPQAEKVLAYLKGLGNGTYLWLGTVHRKR
ncbi:hypothetical protein ACFL5F_04570 [Planctomycetota bacterium]